MFFKSIVVCTFIIGCCQGDTTTRNSSILTRLDLQTFGLNERIIQGQPARLGQFPWQVAIHLEKNGVTYFCGGSLISDEWILTAAQCVYKASSFSIRLGTIQSFGSGEASLQVIAGERGVSHKYFDPVNLHNDIGLIKLANKAQINQYVQPISLANSADRLDGNASVTVSGWGSTRTGGFDSLTLNYVELKTITNEQCRNYYSSKLVIDSTVCCKGTTIQNTCKGDGGGPLVQYINGVAKHVGVVSFISSLGCESGYPSGYARTASFREWIRKNSGQIKNNFNNKILGFIVLLFFLY